MSNTFNSDGTKCNENADDNIIDQCDHLKRLWYAVKFYKDNKNKNNKAWHKFCLNVYGNRVLDDYHHLLFQHADKFEDIFNVLNNQIYNNKGCSLSDCISFTRHRYSMRTT
eukprot:843957_1